MAAAAVVYIRSHPGRPSTPPSVAPERSNGAVSAKANGNTTSGAHRQWTVSISEKEDDTDPRTVVLHDPFTEAQYASVFDRYLRDSDRPRWRLTLDEERDTTDLAGAEQHMKAYAEDLFGQVERVIKLPTECQLNIIEHHDAATTTSAGIHCLAWELLESLPKLHLRTTRISGFRRQHQLEVPQPLSAVKTDPNARFKVLLVVARDFSRTGAERDPEPDLAQYPLMSVQKKLKSRIVLEVVRPGSREELEAHLSMRASHGVNFHLVHFDLHGRIMRDE